MILLLNRNINSPKCTYLQSQNVAHEKRYGNGPPYPDPDAFRAWILMQNWIWQNRPGSETLYKDRFIEQIQILQQKSFWIFHNN